MAEMYDRERERRDQSRDMSVWRRDDPDGFRENGQGVWGPNKKGYWITIIIEIVAALALVAGLAALLGGKLI